MQRSSLPEDPLLDQEFNPVRPNPLGQDSNLVRPGRLGAWNPCVAIRHPSVEEAIIRANCPERLANLVPLNTREPSTQDGPWGDIFPGIPPNFEEMLRRTIGVNWNAWDLESGRRGTGHSARAFLAWAEKNPRRCLNPDCQFDHTGVIGSNIITRQSPHDYWDPNWTLRTGIGTGLPRYDHAATLVAVRDQEDAQRQAENKDNDRYAMIEQIIVGNGTANKACYSNAAACGSPGESSGQDEDEPNTNGKRKAKTLKEPARIKRSARVRLDFEAYRTTPTTNEASNSTGTASERTGGGVPESQRTPGSGGGVKRTYSQTGLESEFEVDMEREDDPFW